MSYTVWKNVNRISRVDGIVDCHTHCGGIDVNNLFCLRYPCTQSVLSLRNTMKKNKVNYAITFPMPSTIYYNTSVFWQKFQYVPSGIEDIPFAIENRYLLAETNAFGEGTILPFLIFSLRDKVSEQCKHIETLMKTDNVYGLKYHTRADQMSIGDVVTYGQEIMELVEEHNIPIMFHSERAGIASSMKVFELACKYNKTRFCLAHFAGFSSAFFKEYDEYLKNYNNIYVDTTPALFKMDSLTVDSDCLDLDYSNPESVLLYFLTKYHRTLLWGTDSPWHFSTSLEEENCKVFTYEDEISFRNAIEKKIRFSSEAVNNFLFGKQL